RLSDWTQSCRIFSARAPSVSFIPQTLMNRDVVAWFYFCRETDDVPIGQTNAAVARRAANRTGLVGAVDADAFFVERDPHHAHRITRSRRKQMKIAAPLSMLEHFLVVTEKGASSRCLSLSIRQWAKPYVRSRS